jgi:hypothetical protein
MAAELHKWTHDANERGPVEKCDAQHSATTPCEKDGRHPDEYRVVISRYHRIGAFDWIAIPLVAYLYEVDRVGDIPVNADAKLESRLRGEYRRRHLLLIMPNVSGKRGGLRIFGLETADQTTLEQAFERIHPEEWQSD